MTQNQKLAALAREVHTSLGGRASADEVAYALANAISPAERQRFLLDHLKVVVSQALRVKADSGLAFAQAIGGAYIQLSLMDEAEYRFVVRQHAALSAHHRRIAREYVAHCHEHLGVDISDELEEAA